MVDRLVPEQTMAAGQGLVANNGRARLVMQQDGNLVLSDQFSGPRRVVWAAGTEGNPGARATMQGDGNFVVYAADGRPLWASHTEGHPGAVLVLQDDGNAVVYAPDGRPLWASHTMRPPVRID